MIRDETPRLMEVHWFGTWARRYYALQFPAGRRVEVVSIVTSDPCLEGVVLYQIGLLFVELYDVPTGRAFSSRVRVCGCMIPTDGVARRAVVVIVIVVVVVIRRRSSFCLWMLC